MKRKVRMLQDTEREVCDRCDIPKTEDAAETRIDYYSEGVGARTTMTKMLCADCLAVVLNSMDKRKRSPRAAEPAAPEPEGNADVVERIVKMLAECYPNDEGSRTVLEAELFGGLDWQGRPRGELQGEVNILLTVRRRAETGPPPTEARDIRKMIAEARATFGA